MKTCIKARAIPPVGRICKTLIVGGAFALAVCSPKGAHAEQSRPQVRVRYDDLNLSSPAGMDALKRRIRSAAEVVCGEDSRGIRDSIEHALCVREAVDRTLALIHWERK